MIRLMLSTLRASLWPVPLAMSLAALAGATLALRARLSLPDGHPLGWLVHAGDAASTRDLLGSLLSGVITMFALAVSSTMVVLALAAAQLGSRLIRSFMEDRATQLVFGAFPATALWLLVVLRAIDDRPAHALPQVAVTLGTALSIACLFLLLFYIDHLARSIVFDRVAHRVLARLAASDRQRHEQAGSPGAAGSPQADGSPEAATWPQPPGDGAAVTAGRDGYVQAIAYPVLVRAACRAGVVLRVAVRPGHWVNADTACVRAWPPDALDATLCAAIRRALVVGAERTPAQDLEYELQRLVEMALRALSPGQNDLFTAIAAIDHLGAAVARILGQPMPSRVLRDGMGQVRVLRDETDADGIVAAAFDPVRQSGGRMPPVAIRLLDTLGRLGGELRLPAQRAAVRRQVDATLASAGVEQMVPVDADAVRARYRQALARCDGETDRPAHARDRAPDPARGKRS